MYWIRLALDILALWSLASLLLAGMWAIAGYRISRAQERNASTRNVYVNLLPHEFRRIR